MAYCPKCKGEMAATAVVCSHCGYDFSDNQKTGRPLWVHRSKPLWAGFVTVTTLLVLAVAMVVTWACWFYQADTTGEVGVGGPNEKTYKIKKHGVLWYATDVVPPANPPRKDVTIFAPRFGQTVLISSTVWFLAGVALSRLLLRPMPSKERKS